MPDHMRYRNNDIEVRDKDDGDEELLINDTPVEVQPDPARPGMLHSVYAFHPAATLMELGQHIVDAQRSLTEPMLPGLQPEEEEAP